MLAHWQVTLHFHCRDFLWNLHELITNLCVISQLSLNINLVGSHNICQFKYSCLGAEREEGKSILNLQILGRQWEIWGGNEEGGRGVAYHDKFLTCQSRYLDRQALDVAPTHCYWLVPSPLGSLYEYPASICISFVSNINTRIQNISCLMLSGYGTLVFPSSAFLYQRYVIWYDVMWWPIKKGLILMLIIIYGF